MKYVTEPVEEGAVHRGSTKGTLLLKESGTSMPNIPFSANYAIEAIEDVTVPAGTFEDCIKIHEEETTGSGMLQMLELFNITTHNKKIDGTS